MIMPDISVFIVFEVVGEKWRVKCEKWRVKCEMLEVKCEM